MPGHLKTFVFTDITSSTIIKQELSQRMTGEESINFFNNRIFDPHMQRLEENIDKYGGSKNNTTGDGYVWKFNDAAQAVQWAIRAQTSLRTNPIDTTTQVGKLEIKIGMHIGLDVDRDQPVPNSAKDRAARIVALAKSGHILISQDIAQLLQQTSSLNFSIYKHRLYDLKGFDPEPIYEVLYEGDEPQPLKLDKAKVLLVTVGGSPQPILTAIDSIKPDRTVFICSDGDGPNASINQIIGAGTPCKIYQNGQLVQELPNIPTYTKLGDRFNPDLDIIRLKDPDDLGDCYEQITTKIRQLRDEIPILDLEADYTGGTKTMSVALVLAALDLDVPLFLTVNAKRQNLHRVDDSESTQKATASRVVVERRLDQLSTNFLPHYNYSAAIAELKSILLVDLPKHLKHRVNAQLNCYSGLEAWDRLEHTKAWQYLEHYEQNMPALISFLRRVMHSRTKIDPSFHAPKDSIAGHGCEIVEDLLLNAERRATQKRYDDAVGRLYRALELLAQIRLQQVSGIRTGDVELEKLPESLQEVYDKRRSPYNDKIQLGLERSYYLLNELGDPLGQAYQQQTDLIRDVLAVRHNSLFAHGLQPITSAEYQQVSEAITKFIDDALTVIGAKCDSKSIQFPKDLNFT
jgi:CRISPR-associated protein (TIGR02710 family)